MKNKMILFLSILIFLAFGCKKKALTAPMEDDGATVTSTSTNIINTYTITNTSTITNTFTITNTITNTFTITETSTITETFTETETYTITEISTVTRTMTATRTHTPLPTATRTGFLWDGPGGGYTKTSNINDEYNNPTSNCHPDGTAMIINSAGLTSPGTLGVLTFQYEVTVTSGISIGYATNKSGNYALICATNAAGTGLCEELIVETQGVVWIPFVGKVKRIELRVNGVGGYIIVNCIQYY